MIMVLHVVVNKIDIIGIRHKVYDLPLMFEIEHLESLSLFSFLSYQKSGWITRIF